MKIWNYEISEILIALICVLILINLGMSIGFGLSGLIFGLLVSNPLIALIVMLNSVFVLIEKIDKKHPENLGGKTR